jgi:hypothetical protein
MRWDWEGGAVPSDKEAPDDADSANHEASRKNDSPEQTKRGRDPEREFPG